MTYLSIKKRITYPVVTAVTFIKFLTALILNKNTKFNRTENIVEYSTKSPIKGLIIECMPYLVFQVLLIIIYWQLNGCYWRLYTVLLAYLWYSIDAGFRPEDEKKLMHYIDTFSKKQKEDEQID